MTPGRFDHFIGIDWSGARGERHKGIAVAIAHAGDGPPALARPDRPWSRTDVLDLLHGSLPANSLIGVDLGIALPYADLGAYFPGYAESPRDAIALWKLVDETCADEPHLGAGTFIDDPRFAPFFRRHGNREGASFHHPEASDRQGRFRVTERAQARMGCKPTSNFNLVGAAQVGRSSLTGMRMLNRLRGIVPVWPIDPVPATGPVLVEIYTALAAIEAGRAAGRSKMTDFAALNAALAALGSSPVFGQGAIDDHSADALVVAAWLRVAAGREDLWQPAGLTPHIARTEGWTFGAR